MTRVKKAAKSNTARCFYCSAHNAIECGPDGVRTLCTDCCDKYCKGTLSIYQKVNGRCSVKSEKAVSMVQKYEFLSTKPNGTSYSRNHIRLNPVVLQVAPLKPQPKSDPGEDSIGQLPPAHNTRLARGKRPRQEPVLSPLLDEKDVYHGGNNAPGNLAKRHCARPTADAVTTVVHDGSSVPVFANPQPLSCAPTVSVNEGAREGLFTEQSVTDARLWVDAEGAAQRVGRGGRWHSVKACYKLEGGSRVVHRFKLEENPHFEILVHGLKFIFKLRGKVDVFYDDDEGDQVSLTSDNEMLELFDLARKYSLSPIRMAVVLGGP